MNHALVFVYVLSVYSGVAVSLLGAFLYSRKKIDTIRLFLGISTALTAMTAISTARFYLSLHEKEALSWAEAPMIFAETTALSVAATIYPFFAHRLTATRMPFASAVATIALGIVSFFAMSIGCLAFNGDSVGFLHDYSYKVANLHFYTCCAYALAVFTMKYFKGGNYAYRRLLLAISAAFAIAIPVGMALSFTFRPQSFDVFYPGVVACLFANSFVIALFYKYFISATEIFPRLESIDVDCARAFIDRYHLSETETRILTLLRKGMLNKQIASELGITEGAVKNRLTSIYKKTKTSKRTELARLVPGTIDASGGAGDRDMKMEKM
jgi:DNA-binding CsgD family transcriptional regulator